VTATHHRPLHDGWSLWAVPGPQVPPAVTGVRIPATVPGCVHTDLLAAGLIPDPHLDDNELAVAWIGRTDWVYTTSFGWDGTDASRVDLVCAGLDTVATVTLNGAPVGRTANMHRGYRFDVRDLLRVGDNVLRVRFESAYRYAERLRDQLGDRPNAYPQPFNFIRKMACHFGWDWGPTLVTAGIWQDIGLHTWSVARLAQVRPLVTVADGVGRAEVHLDVERAVDEPLRVTATVAGVRAEALIEAGQRTAVLTVVVPEPRLWWPRGHGEQARYPLTVTLATAADGPAGPAGPVVDGWERPVGFRSVRLDTAADEHGTAYTLHINEKPIFVRGVNWIPDDTFVTRITRARLAERFAQAGDANVNLLRIWGGGRYESTDFYELADELGLLVQQDFLFACAAYPEEEPLRSEVEAEAAEQVVRLARHPSLVLWNGNNENIWGFDSWGWREQLGDRTWGAGYYFDLLPAIVARLDPTRPYWPGSPWSGRHDLDPNDPAHGNTHIWDVWNSEDYLRYRDYLPRFVAEFGFQGPAAYATLRRALTDDPLTPDSPGVSHHQKAADGAGKLLRGLAPHLPTPRDFDDWHYLTQLNQARAVSVGVEHFRSHRPVCMGTIVWQLNDCWPVTSWSAVDSDGRRKPLWYALRRSYADRLITIAPRDGGLALVAVNDAAAEWTQRVEVTRLTLAGEPRASSVLAVTVPPGSVRTVGLPAELTAPDDPRRELIVASSASTGARCCWFFAEDRDVAYPPADFDATVEPTADGALVRVTARSVLRDLVLYPDRLDPTAVVDEAMVTLLPGQTATFAVRAAGPLPPDALTRRPVLRCVNDVGTE
jgi:beta-mannosidase